MYRCVKINISIFLADWFDFMINNYGGIRFSHKSKDFSLIMRPKYGKFKQLNYLTTHPHRYNKRQNKCREIQAWTEDFPQAGRVEEETFFCICFKEDLREILIVFAGPLRKKITFFEAYFWQKKSSDGHEVGGGDCS